MRDEVAAKVDALNEEDLLNAKPKAEVQLRVLSSGIITTVLTVREGATSEMINELGTLAVQGLKNLEHDIPLFRQPGAR